MTVFAERLQRAKPEQPMVIPVRHHMVSDRGQLFRMIRAKTAKWLCVELLQPPAIFAAPGLARIPLAAWSVHPAFRLRWPVSVMLFRSGMRVTIACPNLNQSKAARMCAGFLWHPAPLLQCQMIQRKNARRFPVGAICDDIHLTACR